MKKKILPVILAAIVGSCFIYDAVVKVKKPATVLPLKQPDASFKKFIYKEKVTADISNYQHVYGVGMPVVYNYY